MRSTPAARFWRVVTDHGAYFPATILICSWQNYFPLCGVGTLPVLGTAIFGVLPAPAVESAAAVPGFDAGWIGRIGGRAPVGLDTET
jgi:hypothetical protein